MSGISSPIRYPMNPRFLPMSYLSYQLLTRTMERSTEPTWEPGPKPIRKETVRDRFLVSVGGGSAKRGTRVAGIMWLSENLCRVSGPPAQLFLLLIGSGAPGPIAFLLRSAVGAGTLAGLDG
jgi:hypothetical protein